MVTDSCKNTAETVETGEDKKTVESAISARKQQLFLPDLVPSGAGAKSDAVSESDEYESADEQPLHGN